MEGKSVKRLGISRPKKGIKVVDLAAKKLGPRKPEDKRLRSVGLAM